MLFQPVSCYFHPWGHLSLRTSSTEVAFHLFKITLIVLKFHRVDLQLLESKFCSTSTHFVLFQPVSYYFHLTRSCSIKDIFHGGCLPYCYNFIYCFEIKYSIPTTLRKQVLLYSNYFTTNPDSRPGRRADGRLEKSILRLTQPSLAGTGAELGNK